MSLKQRIVNALGDAGYRRLLVGGLRAASFYRKREVINPAVSVHATLADDSADCWFGYYDVPATDPSGTMQLCLAVRSEDEPASLMLSAVDGTGMREIATTSAWCWQMGCRAQWFGEGTVLFNDFDGSNFISRVVGVDGRQLASYPFPVYALSRDCRYAFYPDFTILGHLRPGYGYTNLNVDFNLYVHESSNGIWRGNLEDSSIACILTMTQIEEIDPPGDVLDDSSYINHISACPYAERLMFFHLWQEPSGRLRNHVVIIDHDGTPISVLSDFTRASHYVWKDERHLLLTVLSGSACTYRLYDVETGDFDEFSHLSADGHPSYVGDGLFVTDTYPDHLGMQHVLLCSEHGVLAELATVYHNPSMVGEHRCDCHPRYSSGHLSFDSVEGSRRTQHVMRVEFGPAAVASLEASSEDKSDLVRIYKSLCNTREILWPKLAFNRLTNSALKAHLRLHRLTHGRGGKLGRVRNHNVLLERYGAWVSPQATIGKRFRMMHVLGICIGSGTVIGDDCILYQQVTIGKGDNAGFPTLGDGVIVYAGAKIIGNITIGDGAVIGANAVVTRDVPACAVVVGANRVIRALGAPRPTEAGGGSSCY